MTAGDAPSSTTVPQGDHDGGRGIYNDTDETVRAAARRLMIGTTVCVTLSVVAVVVVATTLALTVRKDEGQS
jgi:hypothetical protein